MAIVTSVLGGCASGDDEAQRADEAIMTLPHVAESVTDVSRPGLPTNQQFWTDVTFVDGLGADEQTQALDSILVIARDELGDSANAGYVLHVVGGARTIDMEAAVPALGEVGAQAPVDLGSGSLSLTADALRAYESPEAEQ
ncbi:hypothetical protein [Demequina aestuarii]|uniref:hypothetical protein n=1 Tax=Demequina aestuarii TaxID=327095 RepID=UPI000AE15958|nr:hypothetical protein [Demequina aestuarii]